MRDNRIMRMTDGALPELRLWRDRAITHIHRADKKRREQLAKGMDTESAQRLCDYTRHLYSQRVEVVCDIERFVKAFDAANAALDAKPMNTRAFADAMLVALAARERLGRVSE